MIAEFREESSVDLREDRMALQRLRDASERAKIELSSTNLVDINLPFIYSGEGGQVMHLQKQLKRETLDVLVADLIERCTDITLQAVARARMKPDQLDAVLLVGGMTRMPAVQHAVEGLFKKPPSKGVHPDEVVACGAAIQGALLVGGNAEDALLLDVTPHHLGIMVSGGLFDVLIEKDSTIPTSAKKTFTTVRDDQDQVRILVMQGESKKAQENDLLGEFLLDGLRKAPRGEVKVSVTFDISADGIVGVSAKDLETGREQAITVTASSGLSEDEIRQMIDENQAVAVASATSEAFEEERLEVERLLREVDKLLPQAGPFIQNTEFGAAALQKAEEAQAKARSAIEARDLDRLSASREPLRRTMAMLSNVMKRLDK